MAMPPDNSMNIVSATGLYRFPGHTAVTGTLWFSAMNQNDTLIPWTTNPAIANAGVYQTFRGLASLPRSTAEAKVHGLNGSFNLTSRPNNFFGINMRYRYNDHKNLTPVFDGREWVRFDAVPEEAETGLSERFSIRQNTFDLTGTFRLAPYTSLNLGYIFDDYQRTGRAFSDMRDYTLRAALDMLKSQYVTVRAAYDHTTRIGAGFSEASIEDGGSQGGLRFYDESDMTRDKGFGAALGPEAAFALEAALRLDPKSAEAESDLGSAYLRAGRLSDALPHLARAVTLSPLNDTMLTNWGNALVDAGRLDQAAAIFARALATEPDAAGTSEESLKLIEICYEDRFESRAFKSFAY